MAVAPARPSPSYLPTSIFPVRADPSFALTTYVTRPSPAPLPERTVIHDGEDDADHLQSAAVLTVSENSPPFAVTDWLDGPTSYLHAGAGGGVCRRSAVSAVACGGGCVAVRGARRLRRRCRAAQEAKAEPAARAVPALEVRCRRWRCRCGRRRGRWCSRRFRCGRRGRGRRGLCRSLLHDMKYLVADPDTALSRGVASIGGHRVRDRAQRHPLTEGHGDPVLVGGRVPGARAGHARVEAASVPRHDLRRRGDRQVARGGGRCRRHFDRAAAGRSQRQRTSKQEQARVSVHVR